MNLSSLLQELHSQSFKIAFQRTSVWKMLDYQECSCKAKFVVEYDRFKDRTKWQLTKAKEESCKQ